MNNFSPRRSIMNQQPEQTSTITTEITNTGNNSILRGLNPQICDMEAQTKKLEAEIEAQNLKQRELMNTMRELQREKEKLKVEKKNEELASLVLAQKVKNEEMEKQILAMRGDPDIVIVEEEIILTSNVPNSNDTVYDEGGVTESPRCYRELEKRRQNQV